jgi:hypothetical protein
MQAGKPSFDNKQVNKIVLDIDLPIANELEQAVLGILLDCEEALGKVTDILQAHDFSDVVHQQLYSCITSLAKQGLPFDIVAVAAKASKNPAFGMKEGEMFGYLAGLVHKAPVAANVHYYAYNVKDAARRRVIMQAVITFIQQIAKSEASIDSLLEENIQILSEQVAACPDSSAPRLQAVSLPDLLAMSLKPKEMVLAPWMASQSLSMLHAPRGVGKTWLSLNIGYAISSGGKFLNWNSLKPRGVLIIDGEMSANSLQERLSRLVASSDKTSAAPFKIITPDLQKFGMPDLATYEGQSWVNQHITEDIEVIIVDNISTLVRSGRENEAKSWLPVQQWALNLRANGKSVLFIHHSSKSGGQRGSSRKEDVLDTVIGLRRPEGYSQEQGACFEIHFEKARNFCGEDAKPVLVQLQEKDGKQVWEIQPVEGSTSEKVIELYQQGYSQNKIAEKLDVNKSTVCRYVQQAKQSTGISQYANGGTA